MFVNSTAIQNLCHIVVVLKVNHAECFQVIDIGRFPGCLRAPEIVVNFGDEVLAPYLRVLGVARDICKRARGCAEIVV